MRPAFVVGHGMNLVDDHCLHVAQNRAALAGSQQNVKRLRCRDQDMRRPLQHGPPLGRERVTRAHGGANLGHQQAALAGHGEDFPQRHFKILLDVVAQSLERRNVENFRPVGQIARQRLPHQPVNASQKRSESFARPSGRRNQRGTPGQNVRPTQFLRLRRSAKLLDKPIPHQRVSPG